MAYELDCSRGLMKPDMLRPYILVDDIVPMELSHRPCEAYGQSQKYANIKRASRKWLEFLIADW